MNTLNFRVIIAIALCVLGGSSMRMRMPSRETDRRAPVEKNSTVADSEEVSTINPGPAVYRALDEVLHTLDDIRGVTDIDPSGGRSISDLLRDLRPKSSPGRNQYLGPTFEERLLTGRHPAMNKTKNIRGYKVSVAYEPVSRD